MAEETDNPTDQTETNPSDAESLGTDRIALRDREAARVFALATDLHRRGEYDQAVLAYSRALTLDGTNADIYNNLGVCLRAQGKLAAASACYRRALVLKPNDAGVLSNLGNTQRDMYDLRSAIASLSKAVRNAPQSPEAVYNLGLTLRDAGDNDKAIACFESALGMRKDYATCHVDYGVSLMLKGDLAKGFEEYDWRSRMTAARTPEQPRWDGSDLNGKTILLQQESGMGDVIQFLRYIPAVKEKNANVIVECHGSLARLIATAPGVDKVIIADSPLPNFDVYAPIMSLPLILGTAEDTASDSIPYLSPPELHSIQLPPAAGRQVRVGFCWSPGRPRVGLPDRSCPVSRIVELLAIPGIVAFSLQMGERIEDLKAESCDVLMPDIGSRLTDLADLSAVIDQLDLVVCVDSATAHVAGALGKPTWLLVPFAPDWRWHTEGDTCAWYPSMRLFRQSQPGSWDSVFEELGEALYARAQETLS
ncbi:MAG: glycosyltransferase family protein [Alphaproteobacteria bacterium]|nr:glycosyltransferase family protein [Alphaproteobacteria bacterium]